MHRFDSFPDLRVNTRRQAAEATLWPSFTDIMTVILMVFMLTMVAVIVKNAHLIDSLRLAEQLRAESEQRLQANLVVLADLESLKDELDEKLRGKEMEIILLGDEVGRLEDLLDARALVIDRLKEQRDELQENIRVLRLDVAAKEKDLEDAEQRLGTVQEENEARVAELRSELNDLLAQLDDKDVLLLTLQSEKSDLESELARQRQDFSSLEDRYLRLLRPARSAVGKVVTRVQYSRVGGQERILLTPVGTPHPEPVTKAELYRRLSEMKAKYGDELYVKIVIPDDSGLSYNEAWDFTKDILSKYDYYYAEGWPEEGR
jgi:chromosome segregation ATPase